MQAGALWRRRAAESALGRTRLGKRRVAVICNLPVRSTFSYHQLWPSAFLEHTDFDVRIINCQWPNLALRTASFHMRRIFRPEVVVLLHSTFANDVALPAWLQEDIAGLKAKKIFFLTNTYKNMPAKMAFCEHIGVDVLAQLGSNEEVRQLYCARLPGVTVVPSHAGGLDERLFSPGPPLDERPIDIGFRGEREPFYFGHQERATIMAAVDEVARNRGLVTDMSMRTADRFAPPEWAGFLKRCRAQLGTEGGTDFFSLEDRTRLRVNAYTRSHPDADFAEVYRATMAPYIETEYVRCRLITGRVIESAACKTVLILYEGHYEGFIRPNEHYIPIALDHSNLEEALDKLADTDFCNRLTEASYEVVREKFTFRRLIDEVFSYV